MKMKYDNICKGCITVLDTWQMLTKCELYDPFKKQVYNNAESIFIGVGFKIMLKSHSGIAETIKHGFLIPSFIISPTPQIGANVSRIKQLQICFLLLSQVNENQTTLRYVLLCYLPKQCAFTLFELFLFLSSLYSVAFIFIPAKKPVKQPTNNWS